jgi:RNA polymerase subunit RPABC4/transcription elongation factor Spt4
MSDCPNCGQAVDDDAALCPKCGFDLHSKAAEHVRELREEGKIHAGRIGATDPNEFEGDPDAAEHLPSEMPAEDTPWDTPVRDEGTDPRI